MTRVFFSHATEDKPVVRQVMREVVEAFPNLEPWIDEFEIVSGQSLLAKIGDGMDKSDKFLIFLSPTSITKPWVLAELRDALTLDIQGIKPDFVVPVIIDELSTLPPFLRDKKHIDITRLSREQWLSEIKACIEGRFAEKAVESEPNFHVRLERHALRMNLGAFVFYTDFWAERVAFEIVTLAPILAHETKWRTGGFNAGYREHKSSLRAADDSRFYLRYARQGEMLAPKEEFELRYRMPPGVDSFEAFVSFARWDGSGSSSMTTVLAATFTGGSDLPRMPRVDDPD